jgi:hypothetical protein
VFTHVSYQVPELTWWGCADVTWWGCSLLEQLLLEGGEAVAGLEVSSWGWLAGTSSTASALESTLPLSEPVFFLVQGVQWMFWVVHDELFPPFLPWPSVREQ